MGAGACFDLAVGGLSGQNWNNQRKTTKAG
jgi:hypothetical protein